MLFSTELASKKRLALKRALSEGKVQRFVGAPSPLTALLIERLGFEGVYVSGAVVANDLALPDLGLTGLEEVARRAAQIARVTRLPVLVDVDTGFGEPMSLARTVQVMEEQGVAAVHFEDQQNPKRCGHLDHKRLVSVAAMVKKIRAAQQARRDPNFLLMARTDARGVEGFSAMLARAKAYIAAGAEALFLEALADEAEFLKARQALSVPLLANLTEFGKTQLLSLATLEKLRYNIALYPVTAQRLAMKAIETGLKELAERGSQADSLPQMQTRQELYDLLRYERYNVFDKQIYNFSLPDHELEANE